MSFRCQLFLVSLMLSSAGHAQVSTLEENCGAHVLRYESIETNGNRFLVQKFYLGRLIFSGYCLRKANFEEFQSAYKNLTDKFQDQREYQYPYADDSLFVDVCFSYNLLGKVLFRYDRTKRNNEEIRSYDEYGLNRHLRWENEILVYKLTLREGRLYQRLEGKKPDRITWYFEDGDSGIFEYDDKRKNTAFQYRLKGTNEYHVIVDNSMVSRGSLEYREDTKIWVLRYCDGYRGENIPWILTENYYRKNPIPKGNPDHDFWDVDQSSMIYSMHVREHSQTWYDGKKNLTKYGKSGLPYWDTMVYNYINKSCTFKLTWEGKKYAGSIVLDDTLREARMTAEQGTKDSAYFSIDTERVCRLWIWRNGKMVRHRIGIASFNYFAQKIDADEHWFATNFLSELTLCLRNEWSPMIDSVFNPDGSLTVMDRRAGYPEITRELIHKDCEMDHKGDRVAKDQALCLMGVKDTFGNWIIPANYNWVQREGVQGLKHHVYRAQYGNFITYYDCSGKPLIWRKPLLSDEQFLIADNKGKKHVCFFYNSQDSFYFINLNGKVIFTAPGAISINDYPRPCTNLWYRSRFEVRAGGKYGYYDFQGYYLLPKYDCASRVGDSAYLVTNRNAIDGKEYYSLINQDGKPMIGSRFSEVSTAGKGGLLLTSKDSVSLLGANGKLLFISNYVRYDKITDSSMIIFTSGEQILICFDGRVLSRTVADYQAMDIYQVRYDHWRIVARSSNGLGVVDAYGRILAPFRFDSILILNDDILCKTRDSIFIFNGFGERIWAGGLITPVRLDMNSWQGRYGSYGNFLFWNNKSIVSVLVFTQNGKFGLLTTDGKTFLAPIYDKMGTVHPLYNPHPIHRESANSEIAFQYGDSILFFYWDKTELKRAAKPIFAWDWRLVNSNGESCIMRPDGTILNEKVAWDYNSDLFREEIPEFNLEFYIAPHTLSFAGRYDVFGNRLPDCSKKIESGQADESREPFGQGWIIHAPERKYGYVLGTGDTMLKPIFVGISIDTVHQFYWHYTERYETPESRASGLFCRGPIGGGNYWTFQRGSVSGEDSFDYPFLFYREPLAAVSRDGQWGLANSSGKVVVPMLYDQIYKLNETKYYLLRKGDKIFAMDVESLNVIPLPYDDIKSYNKTHLFARKGVKIYKLNENLIVLDSSDNFFALSARRLRSWFTYGLSTDEYKELNSFPAVKLFAIAERAAKYIIDDMTREGDELVVSWNKNLRSTYYSGPPEMRKYFPDLFHEGIKDPLKNQRDTAPYLPRKFTMGFYFHHENYFMEYFSTNTRTLVSESHTHDMVNVFVKDDEMSIFDLQDLVEDSMRTAFVEMISKKWKQLDDPDLPCVKPERVFDFFKTGFYKTNDGWIFPVSSKYHLSVDTETMKGYLRPYWKERL